MKETVILNKTFREIITADAIFKRIDEIAAELNHDFNRKNVTFLGVLNGVFMFASELFKRINFNAQISFIKLASYRGTRSSGIRKLIGLDEELKGYDIIILEDIVDTGQTLENIVDELILRNVNSIYIATLLLKPEAYSKNIRIDYTGFKIPNDFVIGFGLDYNGYGRNLTSIYALVH